ncbi:MAG: hypothetical protein Q9181_001629 [Wetmoreana brouardii]
MTVLPHTLAVLVVVLVSAFLRLLYVLPGLNPKKPRPHVRGQPTRLLIVLGSGGHTTEMLSLLHDLDPSLYTHRSYVVSSGDNFSALKAIEFESALKGKPDEAPVPSTYDISVIPRARRIHQSLMTTPISSLRCLSACFAILRMSGTQPSSNPIAEQDHAEKAGERTIQYRYPDLILANGPATAVLVIAASLLLRFFSFRGTEGKMRTVYVESWARVNTLSLSGRILVAGGMANRMLVQWEHLARRGQGEFRGALVR